MSDLRFTWIYAGDGIHISAGLLLVGWILQNETCKGISGRTQTVTAIVNFLRLIYVAGGNEYFEEAPDKYALIINTLTSTASLFLIYLMFVKYKKTVEKDYDTFWIEVLIILSICLALAYNTNRDDPLDVLFYTSRYLESGAILPQIYFVFRTGSKKLCVSLYVFLLFLYNLFYIYYIAGTDMKVWGDQKEAPYNIWPAFFQLSFYALYFILLIIIPKYKVEVPLTDVESYTESSNADPIDDGDTISQIPTIIVTRPQLDRQQSLLETPFLKKSLPSTSSLVSYNPDGTARVRRLHSPFPKRKRKDGDSKSLRSVLTLPNISRVRSFGDLSERNRSFTPIETSSEETTPEDEGITFTARETAGQSRRRRIAYVRQTSLPEMSSRSPELSPKERKFSKVESSGEILENNNNLFLPGDEIIIFQGMKSGDSTELDESVPTKQAEQIDTDVGEISKEKNKKNLSDNREVTIAGIIETKVYEQKRFLKSRNVNTEDRSGDPAKKVSNENRTRQKRGSMHHTAVPNHYNWKTIACNFIGTSPTYVRRPSFPNIGETGLGDSGEEFSSRESTLTNQKTSKSRGDVHKTPGDRHRKVSNENRLKHRRATVHHTTESLQQQRSWKTMASAFIGNSPSDARRSSNPQALERSMSDTDTVQNSKHKNRRKTFWHI